MANLLDFITTTNYPSSLLENTFGNKYYQSVVEPTKAAIKSGSTTSKPALGQLIKNWNPLKAFTPQMLATGPTKAASTLLKSSGIGTLVSLLSPTHLGAEEMAAPGQMEQEYYDYYTKYGDIGEYANLKIPEWRKRRVDRKATQQGINQVGMRRRIQEAQAQRAAANQVRQNIQTYGSGDRPSTGMNVAGGGYGQSPTGGDVAGTPFSRGGILGAF